jgi:branched-chain amino acid transport system permease protein
VLTSIEEFTRILFGGTGRGTDTIIYAGLIIVIAVFYPSGVMGWLNNWTRRRREARPPAPDAAAQRPAAAHAPAGEAS